MEGNPPQIGISVKEAALARTLLHEKKDFTLNVPDAGWVTQFDKVTALPSLWRCAALDFAIPPYTASLVLTRKLCR